MKKQYCWPQDHWNWPITVTHKHGVRCGEMIRVGGQVDLDPGGVVLNRGDLGAQTTRSLRNLATVLEGLDCDLRDLVFLLCFYVNDGAVEEADFLSQVAAALPPGTRTAVNAVPVPALAYKGLTVEIEGIAMRRENGDRTTRTYAADEGPSPLPDRFCQAVRSGKMIFVSGQYPFGPDHTVLEPGDLVAQTHIEMARIESLLSQFGAGFGDVVKSNRWYAGSAGIQDFEPAALACASYYAEPGPAATGIPLPRHADDEVTVKLSCVAMLGEDGSPLPKRHVWPETLWDWTLHLPYKHGLKCADMLFLGGQVSLDTRGVTVNPGDMAAQTHQAMEHIRTILSALDGGYDDACKVGSFHRGDCGAEVLHSNLAIRSSYFSNPGPTTTGIPLPDLAYEGMMIEIEIIAMAEPDD